MASKSSYFLAVLLIANPFMLLLFQNCSPNSQERNIASSDKQSILENHETEISFKVEKNLIIK